MVEYGGFHLEAHSCLAHLQIVAWILVNGGMIVDGFCPFLGSQLFILEGHSKDVTALNGF